MCLFIRPICSGCHTPHQLGYLESCGSMPDGIPLWQCPKREHRYEDVECAMCPQEDPETGDFSKWGIRVITIGIQEISNTTRRHANVTVALEAMDNSSGEVTPNDAEAKAIPRAMLLIDGYLVDKRWEKKRQKMIQHEKKRWAGPCERKKRWCCAVM